MTGSENQSTIRLATAADLPTILDIEGDSFSTPWPPEAFISEITERSWSRVTVAERSGLLVGFMVHWIIVTELHLLNLAVRRDWRRRGSTRELVNALLVDGLEQESTAVLLEVRASNRAAKELYRKLGFVVVAVHRGYYTDNVEDALVMSKRLGYIQPQVP